MTHRPMTYQPMTHRIDAGVDAGGASRRPGVDAGLDAGIDVARRAAASGASIPPGFTGGIDAPRAVPPGVRPRIDAGVAARAGARIAAGIDAPNPHTPDGAPATPEFVQACLEEAGLTLMALPNSGPTTRLRQGGLEWVRDAMAYPPERTVIRPAVPSGAAIDRMDRVLAWIPRIPADRFVLRRVVGARCLLSPLTGRHLFTWRRLAAAVGADHKAVQRWHAQGLALIAGSLNAR